MKSACLFDLCSDALDNIRLFFLHLFDISVHLARRLLQLERLNSSLTKDLEQQKEQTAKVSLEVGELITSNTFSVWS